jgi:hypothetical protein
MESRLFEQQSTPVNQEDRFVGHSGGLVNNVCFSGQTAHLIGSSAAGLDFPPVVVGKEQHEFIGHRVLRRMQQQKQQGDNTRQEGQ